MTIRQAIALGTQTLAAVPDPEHDAVALLADATGETPLHLRLRAQECLAPEQEERFCALLLLRAQREPLQYLVGSQCFYGLDFAVDARVLIPRPETETLCELALACMRRYRAPRVLDVCTGSGAIAVTLGHECPGALVTATELSAGALALATENALRNGVTVRFFHGDLLAPVRGEPFDVIVSNPPYIPSADCDVLQPEVRREPRLALDGGADGLAFFRRLAQDAPACLAEGACLLVEVGDGQAPRVAALFAKSAAYTEITIHCDLFGMQRFVTANRAAFPT